MSNPYLNLISAVWHYGKPWRLSIVAFYIALTVAQGLMSLSPYAFGQAINELQYFEPGRIKHVIYWLLVVVAVLLTFWIIHGPARILERSVALKIQQRLRLNLYEQLTRLPLKWHHDHHSGNVITRINRASTAPHRFSDNQFLYIQTIVKFFTSIGFLLWISVPIGLISLFSSLLVMTIVILFDRKLIPLYDAENDIENKVGSIQFDYITNMTTIITLRLDKLTHSNLFQRMMSIWPYFRKESILNETKWFSMMMLFSIVQMSILIGYTVYSINTNETIMLGILVMIFRYQWELGNVFEDLSSRYGEIVRIETDVKSIQAILNDIEKIPSIAQDAEISEQWNKIEIKNLSFHHALETRQIHIFNQINFDISRGAKVALIGESGSGKSTLLNLLSGLYTPDKVELIIDGNSCYSLKPLHSITTLIPQDPEIFENTIAFNISLGLPAELEDIMRAIRLSCFSKVLDNLPDRLETDIRERGFNLSIGQKQRLALARGLFASRSSSLILMDEPTSSVDLQTEREILSGIITAFPQSAMIVSLHRLHLLPQFDSVIMLKQGQIVATGPVYKLLNNPGPVYDLWQSYVQNHIEAVYE